MELMSNKIELTETAETVLKRRYYLKDDEGKVLEDWESLCQRVASSVAKAGLTTYGVDLKEFFKMIYNLDFLPNSPCLMNAGTELSQLSACFVLPIEDSMEGIFMSIRNGALVHQSGGGTGYSFSRLRPKNSLVHSTQGAASGPLSFMSVFDSATETIKQGGKRRGANMGVLRVDHPDIMEFISAKEDPNKLNNFNLSVAITDKFMEAVKLNSTYDLINPADNQVTSSLNAVKVFDRIIDYAWENGEPGVLFIDTANRANPTPHLGDLEATNPCGEQWLLPYESCNLGSINLGNFVVDKDEVDYERIAKTVKTAVHFLDNVIDCNKYPIPEIEKATQQTRKIGLGIMGLHDMLIQVELPYGSKEGRCLASTVMQFIRDEAEIASIDLAKENGAYPAQVLPSQDSPPFVQPMRNAALTSIQPTGTVSMIADCSSGCEPYYSIVTEKNVMDGDSFLMVNKHFEAVARREGFFSDKLMEKVSSSGTVIGHDEIPTKWQDIFRTAQDITPEEHISMQGILQTCGVDASISKTINLSSQTSKEDVRKSYLLGYELGCKGLTVYRDGSRDSQVLNTTKKPKVAALSGQRSVYKIELPDVLSAKRYRLKGPDGDTIYIIICFDEAEQPMEVFAKFPYENQDTNWTTTCRLVSLALRCQVPIEEIIKQLDKSSGHMFDLPAQLGKLLKSFMSGTQQGFSDICPECLGALSFEEGCSICIGCGYSKCS